MDDNSLNLPTTPRLKEGYFGINIVSQTYGSESELIDYLRNELVSHFQNHQFKILEIKKEFRPTNYLKNNRNLRTFIVEGSLNQPHLFVFDVETSILC